MLSGFRKFGETKASKAMLMVLIVSFGAWGIGGYLMNVTSGAAITVNGQEVSMTDLDRSLKQREQLVEQLTGTKPTEAMKAEMHLPQSVIQEAISRLVLRQTAEAMHLVAAPKALREEIASMPSFQTNGKFDKERYAAATSRVGLTTGQFETELGHDLSVRLLGQLVHIPTIAGAPLTTLSALQNATLTLETLTLGLPSVQNLPTPTAAEVEKFYKDNPKLYTIPEKRNVLVLEITAASLNGTITVPDAAVEAYYKSHSKEFAMPSKRQMRHILLTTKEEAEKLAPSLKTEAEFETAAKANSTDEGSKANGGALGSIAPSDVVKEFADVAFSLPEGKVSAPVQSPFGWHLIWVSKIEPARTLSYDEVKTELKKQLEGEEAAKALSELENKVADALAAGDDLEKVAKDQGLKLLRFPMISAENTALAENYRGPAFAGQPKEVSAPINLPDAGVAYVEATDVIPARVPPLADVKAEAEKDARTAQLQTALQVLANKVLGSARDPNLPAGLGGAANRTGVQGAKVENLTLASTSQVPDWLNKQVTAAASLPVGGLLPTPIQNGENWVLVRLTGRTLATPSIEDLQKTATSYQKSLQSDVEAMVINHLAGKANITYSLPRLKQVFGNDFTLQNQ